MAELPNAPIFSVTQLNRMVREVLEQSFPLFWVAGEISNLTRAASGHWYFTLKDDKAQVRCVMFRGKNQYLDWMPREGDHVEARALVTLYEARGDFQLTIESLQKAGLGALYEAFEKLKAKLEREGLFAAENKLPLPAMPRQVGIVTSPDAAALRDVLTTLKRRMPALPIVIYPTPVQGKGAAEKIAAAITTANARAECDVLILCRGGGSMEDLWQFNEECVARAMAASAIPIISGVGHETDFTIADFAADRRAPTPTAAAEMACPDRMALLQGIQQLHQRLQRQIRHTLNQKNQQLDYLARRLQSPRQQLEHRRLHLAQMAKRLEQGIRQPLNRAQEKLLRLQQNLAHLSPLAVLERGYSLAQKKDGSIVTHAQQLTQGESLHLTFAHGQAESIVQDIHHESSQD
jgi:exodeoxyribonuclease VII large subunit